MYYSVPVAYVLWAMSGFGALGLHRFYLGKIGTGFLWFITGGMFMLGSVYDLLTLPRQVRDANIRAVLSEALESSSRSFLRDGGRLMGGKAAGGRSESIEKVILRTARRNGGSVTPGEVVLEGDVPLEDARAALDKMAGEGYANMRIRTSGVIVYVFPEFFREGRDDFEVGI
ncbi:MAG TPA: TM2 domain-containing protein [Magnetospirillaceae bacterium]|nr:TM2 domain-containing protein [Magnetospirillaceae bacterium]